jgi:diacylglycerol O-acyltransferase / wax synthase
MRQLSGLDASFLYIETPETPMHVGSLTIYDPPNDAGSGEKFVERVRLHLSKRLHLAPLLYQRLELMPFDLGHPVWVDMDSVNLDYHVQAKKLPKPGTLAQLESLVAKLHEGPLDRSFPLWQFFVIEGMKDGSIALYSKIHHAALDGAAGVMLANAMLDITEIPRDVPKPEARQKAVKPHSQTKLLGTLFSNTIAQYAKIVRTLPDAVKQIASATMQADIPGKLKAGLKLTQQGGLGQMMASSADLLAPKTPFNVSITAARSFATLSLPLKEIKAIAPVLEASVNDLVMTICAGALRRILQQSKELPKRSLIAAVPINLRAIDDTAQNNQVTMLPCTLGTDQKTALARLNVAKGAMAQIKSNTHKFKSFIPTDYPSFGAPWLVGGLAQLYAKTKLADRIAMPANVVISNVPGPTVPLYLAGAKMRSYFPLSIVVHGMALNITMHSYAGSMDIGVTACAKAIPDLGPLMQALKSEFDDLKRLTAMHLLGKTPMHEKQLRVVAVKKVAAKLVKAAAKSAPKKKVIKRVLAIKN